jgi:polysaccharide biosynthesis/export protein
LYKKILAAVVLILLVALNVAYAQEPSSQQLREIYNALTPEQQQAIQQDLMQRQAAQPQAAQPQDSPVNFTPAKQQPPPVVINNLTSAQLKTVQYVLGKTKGILTPQAIEALRQSPDFQSFTPESIARAKDLIEKNFIPEDESRRSFFERSRQVGKFQDIDLKLMPFGYDFFHPTTVEGVTARNDVPIPSKYIVGPGDEVRILFWGRVNAQHNLIVDRKGSINIPNVGPIYVAGMTFEKMATNLIQQASQIVGANIDVSMGALKTIPVFVLGDVKKPGAYTIGSFGTITDALLLAGGPSEIGSMRNIQLKRKDGVIATFDLYKLLLRGDKSADLLLQAGDVVFVPVSGPLVGIAGNVKRPAIYQLKDKFNLQELLDLAGGIVPTAYTQQIQIERIIKNEKQVIVDIDDKHLAKSKLHELQDADLVKVFSIVDADTNAVFLDGHVKKPGKYEMKPGMKLKDIIKSSADLQTEPYYEYAVINRTDTKTGETVLIPFHLGKLVMDNDPEANLTLMPKDEVHIFSAWMFKDKPSFSIAGEIRKPKQYALMKNLKVKDAILAAGGLTKDADLQKAEIVRRGKNQGAYEKIYFNVAGAIAGKIQDNVLLQDKDKIVIHSVNEYAYKRTVSIEGDILNPGEFQFFESMRVKDLVYAAGNILESAYLEDAEITSMKIEEGKAVKLVHQKVNLRKALAGDEKDNIKLAPYDRLFVRKMLNWRREQFVTVSGETKFPGRYMITKGEKLSSLIERAGGYTDEAYLRGAVFTREKVKDMQQKSIAEMTERLEKELFASSVSQAAKVVSAEEIEGKKVEIEQKKQFIEKMKKTKALGRLTIKLAHLRLLKGSEYDVELEDGDTLFIPEQNSVVGVAGAVMSAGAYIFSAGLDYQDYINMSGGYSRYADTGNVFILKVDGSARKASRGLINWNAKKDRLEMAAFSDMETGDVEPGDVIVVQESFAHIAWLREIRDITQILMNTAVAAGVVIKLF